MCMKGKESVKEWANGRERERERERNEMICESDLRGKE